MTTTDFDARAATWDDDPAKVERAQAVADAIARHVPLAPSMRAIEYGAGTGLPVVHAARPARRRDARRFVGRHARRCRGQDRRRQRSSDARGQTRPTRRCPAGAVSPHHLLGDDAATYPDTDAILRRFHAALARPGYLCIADLDTEDGSFHGPGVDVHHGFDRAGLAAKARAAGFASVEFSTAHVMTKAVNGTPRQFPVFLMVAGTR